MQFTVLNDRAQGGGSVKDGEIEIMVRFHEIYIRIYLVMYGNVETCNFILVV